MNLVPKMEQFGTLIATGHQEPKTDRKYIGNRSRVVTTAIEVIFRSKVNRTDTIKIHVSPKNPISVKPGDIVKNLVNVRVVPASMPLAQNWVPGYKLVADSIEFR